MAYIYQITNDVNNKIYIGKTEFSIEKRFQEHCRDAKREYRKDRPLYRAMNKYGIEHFHIELLEETDNPEERERYWIELKGSFKNGYNATLGGDGKRYLDYDLIIKTYEKIQNATKVADLLNIDRMGCLRILHSQGVKVLSAGEVAQISVVQIDKDTNEIIKIFSGVREAEEAIGIRGHISQVCKGKRKTCGGYKWKYLSDIEPSTQAE